MTRIVYLASSTIPSRSANSVHVMKMCQAFADNGHDVELVAPERDPDGAGADEAFALYSVRPVFRFSKLKGTRRKWGSLLHAFRASRYAKRARPDLVYGRDVQACFQAALLGLPVVLEIHDLKFLERGLHFSVAFSSLLRAKSFRYLVVISEALATDIIALYPKLAGRVRVSHDGADPVADDASATQSEESANLRAGYVGSIYAGRGLEVLEAISRRLPWLSLHIVGNWHEGGAAKNHGDSLPPNVRVHGFLPYADAERVRIACDVLLAPYRRQVFTAGGSDISRWMSPLKLFEYMAAGKAIVCSDIPVLHEVLVHLETAWFCPPDDIDSWCAALTQLRDDEELRLRLGRAAKEKFLRLHTWKARAAAVLQAPETQSQLV